MTRRNAVRTGKVSDPRRGRSTRYQSGPECVQTGPDHPGDRATSGGERMEWRRAEASTHPLGGGGALAQEKGWTDQRAEGRTALKIHARASAGAEDESGDRDVVAARTSSHDAPMSGVRVAPIGMLGPRRAEQNPPAARRVHSCRCRALRVPSLLAIALAPSESTGSRGGDSKNARDAGSRFDAASARGAWLPPSATRMPASGAGAKSNRPVARPQPGNGNHRPGNDTASRAH